MARRCGSTWDMSGLIKLGMACGGEPSGSCYRAPQSRDSSMRFGRIQTLEKPVNLEASSEMPSSLHSRLRQVVTLIVMKLQ